MRDFLWVIIESDVIKIYLLFLLIDVDVDIYNVKENIVCVVSVKFGKVNVS